jgi:hypothetical protein
MPLFTENPRRRVFSESGLPEMPILGNSEGLKGIKIGAGAVRPRLLRMAITYPRRAAAQAVELRPSFWSTMPPQFRGMDCWSRWDSMPAHPFELFLTKSES